MFLRIGAGLVSPRKDEILVSVNFSCKECSSSKPCMLSCVPRYNSYKSDSWELNPDSLLVVCAVSAILTLPVFFLQDENLQYRAPEMLLGFKYSSPVDMWAAGCIFAKMVPQHPLFNGTAEVHIVFAIFRYHISRRNAKLYTLSSTSSLDLFTFLFSCEACLVC